MALKKGAIRIMAKESWMPITIMAVFGGAVVLTLGFLGVPTWLKVSVFFLGGCVFFFGALWLWEIAYKYWG